MKQYEKYLKAEEDKKNGVYDGAPWYVSFPRMGELLPVISKGEQIMLLAGSGLGKSQSFIGLVLLPVYRLIKLINYKVKFYIFLLEDPESLFRDRLFSRILCELSGQFIDPMSLWSKRKDYLSEDIKKLFPVVEEILEDILKYCVIIDNIYNATGIYKYLRTESNKYGEHFWKDKEFTYKNENGTTHKENVKVYSHYTPTSNEHVIVCIDNLNNLAEESGGTIADAISKWCRDYARLQVTKHWKWTVWNIMQTSLETDKQQFSLMHGKQVIEKVEPNLSSLGDNKRVSRDHHLILSLFSPARFGITKYEDYDIERLEDNFRSLIILKSNFSISNRKIPFYFNGASSLFLELPKASEMEEKHYKAIETKKLKFDKFI